MNQFSVKRLSVLFTCLAIFLSCVNSKAQNGTLEVSKAFVENVIKGNKDAALSLVAIESIVEKDSIIEMLNGMQYRVMSDFGRDVSIKPLGYNEVIFLFGSEKVRRANKGKKSSYIQIEDRSRFSVFQITINEDNKVVSFGMLNQIYTKPTSRLWLVGILTMLCILAFNVYVIIKVYRSNVVRRWLKYLMIILLNLPVFGYNALSGFFFKFLGLNLLGVSAGWTNYFNTYWSIGVPIGSIIVLWRLKNNLYRTKDDDWIYNVTSENT
jgi:hypothetical protein